MASTAIACLQQLFLFAILLIPYACSANPVHQYCGGRSFADNLSDQKTSISNVLFDLLGKSFTATFAESSFDIAGNSGTARGLFQCRADIGNKTCMWCVVGATNYLMKTCSSQADGRVWYDDCFLRYSVNDDFFGRADTEHGGFPFDSRTTSTPTFKDAVGQVLSDVVASAARSGERFGKEQKAFEGNVTIYGMAQCTQDLSLPTCRSCLESAVGAIPTNCFDHTGCRALLTGCWLRYDIVNFFDIADDGSQ